MKFRLMMAILVAGVGCAGPTATTTRPQPAMASPGLSRMKVRVAKNMAIVTEGSVPTPMRDELVKAVESSLRARGINVVFDDSATDLTIRIDTRITGAIAFLRGRVTLEARRGNNVVAQGTSGTENRREKDFAHAVADKAVAALLESQGFLAYSRGLAPPTVAQVQKATPVAPAAPAAKATPVPVRTPAPRLVPTNPMAKAKAHHQRATSFYNLGRFREALIEYENAYLAVPDPPFLFNLGQCHRKLGNNEDAMRFYRSYLREAPAAPNRVEVERWIEELARNKHAAR